MLPSLVTIMLVLVSAVPASADTGRPPVQTPGQTLVEPSRQPLRVMNDAEFNVFLGRLDTEVLHWKVQLSQMDMRSLTSDRQQSAELARSQDLCLRSLDGTRKEIQSLSQKQTLRVDFLLLVDLNDLARNLDEFNRDLIDANGESLISTRKPLDYARGVLSTDAALALYIAEFQRHILAYAGMIDATLDQAKDGADLPGIQN